MIKITFVKFGSLYVISFFYKNKRPFFFFKFKRWTTWSSCLPLDFYESLSNRWIVCNATSSPFIILGLRFGRILKTGTPSWTMWLIAKRARQHSHVIYVRLWHVFVVIDLLLFWLGFGKRLNIMWLTFVLYFSLYFRTRLGHIFLFTWRKLWTKKSIFKIVCCLRSSCQVFGDHAKKKHITIQ